jgi:hypothetical protein
MARNSIFINAQYRFCLVVDIIKYIFAALFDKLIQGLGNKPPREYSNART